MVAILHNIRSLHNVGSMFRTADAAGIEKLYLCGITPAPVDRFGKVRPQVHKVALGAERFVTWERQRATSKVIDKLKRAGFKIVDVEQSPRAIPYYRFKIIRAHSRDIRVALVMGNEVRGLPETILRKADTIVEIPMRGEKESLNVAVAFGIVAFHMVHG